MPEENKESWESRFEQGWDNISDLDSVSEIRKRLVIAFISAELARERKEAQENMILRIEKMFLYSKNGETFKPTKKHEEDTHSWLQLKIED